RSIRRIASTSRPSDKDMASRAATDIFRHCKYQRETTAREPHSHTPTSVGSRWTKMGNAFAGVTPEITSMAKCRRLFVTGDPGNHAKRLPIVTSSEKGIRNLMDAASQTQ